MYYTTEEPPAVFHGHRRRLRAVTEGVSSSSHQAAATIEPLSLAHLVSAVVEPPLLSSAHLVSTVVAPHLVSARLPAAACVSDITGVAVLMEG